MLNQKRIMLLVTESCNLRCKYCYEHRKNNSRMSFEKAKEILDEHLEGADERQPIIIEEFGGEAFNNFGLIKQIDEYLKAQYPKLNIMYETTTNGTLVHGEIQDWLTENKDRFYIALSLDGTKKMHDTNRVYINGEGSFDKIDLDFFLRTWPGCPAKMTTSDETLPYLFDGIKYIDDLGFRCDATLSVGVDWNPEKNIPILIRELGKLIDYYIAHPEKELCTMLNFDFRLFFTPADDDYRYCGAGIDMLCFDTAGNEYPCQGFAPVSIGEASKEFLKFDHNKFRFTDENVCKKCPLVRFCPNCYAANLQSTGDIQKVDPNLCKLFKLCILAGAKIQCNRILAKDSFTEDDKLVLKAISLIEEYLKNDL